MYKAFDAITQKDENQKRSQYYFFKLLKKYSIKTNAIKFTSMRKSYGRCSIYLCAMKY